MASETKPVGVGPLHYQGFPPPNVDTTKYKNAEDYIKACYKTPGGIDLLCQSSDVEKFRYDAKNRTLYVTFRNKRRKATTPTAVYYPMTDALVELFVNASSKGQFMWVVLRGSLAHLHTGYA